MSADPKSNLFNHQYTSLVTLAEACKEDLVVVDARTASRLGSLPRLFREVRERGGPVGEPDGSLLDAHGGRFKAPPSVRGVSVSRHRRDSPQIRRSPVRVASSPSSC